MLNVNAASVIAAPELAAPDSGSADNSRQLSMNGYVDDCMRIFGLMNIECIVLI